MKTPAKLRLIALLLGALAIMSSYAQDVPENAAPEALDLTSLESTWWSHFEQPGDDTKSRADDFLADVGAQIAALQTPNQAVGQSLLIAVRDRKSVV